jgi:hypothetical protein
MADIFLHFRNKFARNPELISTTEPLATQSLERTQDEITDYEQWKNATGCTVMLNWLREQFMAHQCSPSKTHDGIDFFSTATSKGFRMHPALTRFSELYIRHLFNYLKDRACQEHYKVSLSDTRIFGRVYWNETIHRHILKPLTEGGIEFAQLTVTLTLKDDKLVHLGMEVFIPNTDLPRPSDDFAELMQALLA